MQLSKQGIGFSGLDSLGACGAHVGRVCRRKCAYGRDKQYDEFRLNHSIGGTCETFIW